LEAMQEFEVTYAGKTHPLPRPFFILATQNPIEQSGTYPLPEAQLDRFLLYIKIGYPTAAEELAILTNTTGNRQTRVEAAMTGEEITGLQRLVREVSIHPDLVQYIAQLVRATRPDATEVAYVKNFVRWGAGPRAGQALVLTAKARALLQDRFAVTPDDVRTMAYPVLRHRVLLNFNAEAEGIIPDQVVTELLKVLRLPEGKLK
ncbi:MAG: MoxR family ATPase, partial [Ferruginibacter sp.]|nr:MoxR family ATPase [Cytophagales bacterium]